MSKGTVVETIYGKVSKYEIVRKSIFGGFEFYIYKDGQYWAGTFPTLSAAVDYVKKR